MKAYIQVDRYWLVAPGRWTLNGEHAMEHNSRAALQRSIGDISEDFQAQQNDEVREVRIILLKKGN